MKAGVLLIEIGPDLVRVPGSINIKWTLGKPSAHVCPNGSRVTIDDSFSHSKDDHFFNVLYHQLC